MSRLLLPSAKIDALIHAAEHDCEPAIRLFQPGAAVPTKPLGDPEDGNPEGPIPER
jgi:hypothetical protein